MNYDKNLMIYFIVLIGALSLIPAFMWSIQHKQKSQNDNIQTSNFQQFIDTCTANTRGQINMSVSMNEETGRTVTWIFEDIEPSTIISK